MLTSCNVCQADTGTVDYIGLHFGFLEEASSLKYEPFSAFEQMLLLGRADSTLCKCTEVGASPDRLV